MQVIPRAMFLANKDKLANGDIVGFVTAAAQSGLFPRRLRHLRRQDGELLLRHAAQSRHRVLDERMDRFVAQNHVRYVTLLRPEEPAAALRAKRI